MGWHVVIRRENVAYNETPTKGNTMFKKAPTEKSELDIAISDLFADMADNNITKDSKEFASMVDQVVKLYALKEVDSNVKTKNRVSKDTLAVVVANLLGIVMIVGHERANVVTSKALNLLTKLR